MKLKKLIKMAHRFADPYRISDGDKFRLKDVAPGGQQMVHPVDRSGRGD